MKGISADAACPWKRLTIPLPITVQTKTVITGSTLPGRFMMISEKNQCCFVGALISSVMREIKRGPFCKVILHYRSHLSPHCSEPVFCFSFLFFYTLYLQFYSYLSVLQGQRLFRRGLGFSICTWSSNFRMQSSFSFIFCSLFSFRLQGHNLNWKVQTSLPSCRGDTEVWSCQPVLGLPLLVGHAINAWPRRCSDGQTT